MKNQISTKWVAFGAMLLFAVLVPSQSRVEAAEFDPLWWFPSTSTAVTTDGSDYAFSAIHSNWRIDRRRINDGTSLSTAVIDYGPNEYIQDIVVDSTGIYTAGTDSQHFSLPVYCGWRVEKRSLDLLVVLWTYRMGGCPGPEANAAFLQVYSGELFVAGHYDGEPRIERRRLNNGALIGSAITLTQAALNLGFVPGTTRYDTQGLYVDGTGIYVAGGALLGDGSDFPFPAGFVARLRNDGTWYWIVKTPAPILDLGNRPTNTPGFVQGLVPCGADNVCTIFQDGTIWPDIRKINKLTGATVWNVAVPMILDWFQRDFNNVLASTSDALYTAYDTGIYGTSIVKKSIDNGATLLSRGIPIAGTGSPLYDLYADATGIYGGSYFPDHFVRYAPGTIPLTVDLKLDGQDGLPATPVSVLLNSAHTFTWNVTGATSCTASSAPATTWIGAKPVIMPVGGEAVTVTGDVTYTLTCTNGGAPVSDSVIVNLQRNLLVCQNTCGSGTVRDTTAGVAISQTGSQNLVACYTPLPNCSDTDNTNNVTASVLTSWVLSPDPDVTTFNSSLSSIVTGGISQRQVSGTPISGSDEVQVTYQTPSLTDIDPVVDVSVLVTCPAYTCSTASIKAQTDRFCPTEKRLFDNNCGGQIDAASGGCRGTRDCDFNWREVAPQ